MRYVLALLAVGLAAFAVAFPAQRAAHAESFNITVELTGAQEVPAVSSPAAGIAHLIYDSQARTLQYTLTAIGVSPDVITAAHIHRGAAGVSGPAVYTLASSGFTTVTGTINLTAADVGDLERGNFYVNIHTVQFPGGAARGQIYLTAEDAIRATLQGMVNAWNSKSVAGFLSFWTDQGLAEEFGLPLPVVQELKQAADEIVGDPPITLRSVVQLSVSGITASATVDLAFAKVIKREQLLFTRTGGAWKVTGVRTLNPDIPAGATVADLAMREFAFQLSQASFANGNIAFRLSNAGAQPHEVFIMKVPSDLNLAQFVQTEGPPPAGVEEVGFRTPIAGGTSTVVTFTEPLAPGRYALLCFVPDIAGDFAPHAVKGMFASFTVGAGAITPPSTGDAGLADGPALSIGWLLAGGALLGLISIGGGMALAFRRR